MNNRDHLHHPNQLKETIEHLLLQFIDSVTDYSLLTLKDTSNSHQPFLFALNHLILAYFDSNDTPIKKKIYCLCEY
jgi:hypothetical protein